MTITAFPTAEAAWFWFIDANQARLNDKPIPKGSFDPVDILRIIDRLYKKRRLSMDHLRVLRFYGTKKVAPESWRKAEARAATIWDEAMKILDGPLTAKGIVQRL